MEKYIEWYRRQEIAMKVILAIFWVPAFLYRLFSLILNKDQIPNGQIIYFILTLIPGIGVIFVIIDIVYACKGVIPLSLDFGENEKEEEKEECDEAKEEVAEDLARALHVEARNLAAAGCSIIQVDEPILSTGAVSVDTAKKCLSIIFDGIDTASCIHTCGILGGIASEWSKLPVDILDFEYAVSKENLDTLSKQDLHGKKIGCGCVKSSNQNIESVEEIQENIISCIDVFGKDNILIDPDCGLRMHTPEGAYQKLANMCEAVRSVRMELL